MKVVFAGPSLYRLDIPPFACQLRPPARRGDLLYAVQDGAEIIGLIDGVFETTPSVWHKEILFALSCGVRVFGAASLGALRAAECSAFGMEGIGAIFEQYRSSQRTRDADVALTYAPAEFGYAPLTEALVDVEWTLSILVARQVLAPSEATMLHQTALCMHFKQRSWKAMMETAGFTDERQVTIRAVRHDLGPTAKQLDAIQLISAVATTPSQAPRRPPSFSFNQTVFFDRLQQETLSGDVNEWR